MPMEWDPVAVSGRRAHVRRHQRLDISSQVEDPPIMLSGVGTLVADDGEWPAGIRRRPWAVIVVSVSVARPGRREP